MSQQPLRRALGIPEQLILAHVILVANRLLRLDPVVGPVQVVWPEPDQPVTHCPSGGDVVLVVGGDLCEAIRALIAHPCLVLEDRTGPLLNAGGTGEAGEFLDVLEAVRLDTGTDAVTNGH